MRSAFWLRAIGPHIVFAAVVSGCCLLLGRAVWFAPVLVIAQLTVWYWTDLLLTDRIKGERMIRDSAEYINSSGRKTHDPELLAWGLLAVVFLVAHFILLATGMGPLAGIVILGLDLPLLALALYRSDAYSAFGRHVYPRLERLWQIQDARCEVRQYYDCHPELHDVYPRPLLRSALKSVMPDTAEPVVCWRACRKLLKTLHALAAEARAALWVEEERRRKSMPPPVPDHRESSRATLQAVLDELRMGLPPETIARSLEESLGDPSPPASIPSSRTLTPDDFDRR